MFCVAEKFTIMLSAASVSPIPGLRTSTQVGVGWRFARALDSLGRVGLDGPVSACGRDTEGCLSEAQAELKISGTDQGAVLPLTACWAEQSAIFRRSTVRLKYESNL